MIVDFYWLVTLIFQTIHQVFFSSKKKFTQKKNFTQKKILHKKKFYNFFFFFEEYKKILEMFNARDLFLEFHSPEEEITSLDSANYYCYVRWKGRIDYVFAIDHFFDENQKNEIQFFKLKSVSCDIVQQEYKKEFSDHYPVLTKIVPC